MTHRQQSGIIPHRKEGLTEPMIAHAASPTEAMPVFDLWGSLEGFVKLGGSPVFSPEKSHAWAKNWMVLWDDQMRRYAFYLKWL